MSLVFSKRKIFSFIFSVNCLHANWALYYNTFYTCDKYCICVNSGFDTASHYHLSLILIDTTKCLENLEWNHNRVLTYKTLKRWKLRTPDSALAYYSMGLITESKCFVGKTIILLEVFDTYKHTSLLHRSKKFFCTNDWWIFIGLVWK